MDVALDVAEGLRAQFIRTLLQKDPVDAEHPPLDYDDTGARIEGGRIIGGDLDFTALHFDKPIEFTNTVIEGAVILRDARLGRVCLDYSTTLALDAENAELSSDLSFAFVYGCGYVLLRRARIKGLVDLQGTRLDMDDDDDEAGTSFEVLNANAAVIGGSLWLRNGFEAIGRVWLVGADIGGQFDCSGGKFRNPQETALHCDAMTVGADVFLSDGCEADGIVNFIRSAIQGNFDCRRGAFRAPGRDALDLQGAVIGGTAYLNQISKLDGGVDLRDVQLAILADDESAWPTSGALRLNGLTYERFADDYIEAVRSPTGWRKRCDWLSRQPSEDLGSHFKPQPWTQLAKVLRSMGHTRAASQILFQRERRRLSWANQDVSKREWLWRTALMGLPAGFGYQTHRAVGWLVLLWALGVGVYALAYEGKLFRPSSEEIVAHPDYQASGIVPEDYEGLDLALYSLDVLIPLADFHQERHWLPRGGGERAVDFADRFKGIARVPGMSALLAGLSGAYAAGFAKGFFYFQIAMGWFLTTIAAAGFTGFLERKE